MTLAVGDHVVKLGKDGKPLTTDQEVYIEYQVEALTGYMTGVDEKVLQGAVLSKVK